MLDAGSWMLVPGCWFLDAGSWMLVPGCWFLDAGSWMLVTGYWFLDAGHWMLVTGYWIKQGMIFFYLSPLKTGSPLCSNQHVEIEHPASLR
jgi:hypothetical protein